MKLLNILPKVKGSYEENVPLKNYTTLKIGGNAEVLFIPKDFNDLATFLKNKPENINVFIIGEGSNILLPDEDIKGVVIYFAKNCDEVLVEGNFITAEAGATSGKVARCARENSLTGLEFLCGIPGSIGGALKMNAGAYGCEVLDNLVEVKVLTNLGEFKIMKPEEIGFSYRKSNLPKGWFYIWAKFKLQKGEKEKIRQKMREINSNRTKSQPLNMPSSGSWFKNVVLEDGSKINAWKIVDEAGCRGLSVGGAMVSEKHANFFVNVGGATARDMLNLSKKVKEKVKKRLGVELVEEVRLFCVNNGEQNND